MFVSVENKPIPIPAKKKRFTDTGTDIPSLVDPHIIDLYITYMSYDMYVLVSISMTD